MKEILLITHCDLIRGGFILEKNCYIRIENGIICKTGPMDELNDPGNAILLDGAGKLAIPGLINGHNHSAMTLFRGLADDIDLHVWLNDYIFPAESKNVSSDMVYWCAKLAAAEMLLSGTTCVADGYFYCNSTARAFVDSGLRAIVAHGVLDFPAPGIPNPSDNIDTVSSFIEQWREAHPLITPGVFAHSAYTCSPHTLQSAKKLADKNGLRFFIHAAETAEEKQLIIDARAATPIQHLKALGILDSNCVLIHGVWMNEEDMDTVASTGAGVILCPQSNYKLASGKSPASDMAARKIPLGLGTDGCASNNSLDMFREMDIFAKSQKAFHADPTIFPAEEVFTMATEGSAKVLGQKTPPTLDAGNRADIVLLDLKMPQLTPFYGQDLLVYATKGDSVHTVIVGGKTVVENRQLLTCDLEETKKMVQKMAGPLIA